MCVPGINKSWYIGLWDLVGRTAGLYLRPIAPSGSTANLTPLATMASSYLVDSSLHGPNKCVESSIAPSCKLYRSLPTSRLIVSGPNQLLTGPRLLVPPLNLLRFSLLANDPMGHSHHHQVHRRPRYGCRTRTEQRGKKMTFYPPATAPPSTEPPSLSNVQPSSQFRQGCSVPGYADLYFVERLFTLRTL